MSGGQKTMMPQHLAQGAACCNPRPQQRFGLAAGSRQGGGGGGWGRGCGWGSYLLTPDNVLRLPNTVTYGHSVGSAYDPVQFQELSLLCSFRS